MRTLQIKKQKKQQAITLQCEPQLKANKIEVKKDIELLTNQVGILSLEDYTPNEVQGLFAEIKNIAEEKLIEPVKTEVSLDMEKIGGANDKREIEQKENSYEESIGTKTRDYNFKKSKQDTNAKEYQAEIKIYQWIKPLVVFTTCFEIFLCAKSLEVIMPNTFLAYLSAGVLGVAVHTYVSEIPERIMVWSKGSIKKELLYFLLALLPLAYIFWELAFIRKNHAEELLKLDEIEVQINAGLFVALNMLSVIAGLLLVRTYRPDKSIRKAYKTYKQQQKELDKEQKEIEALKEAKEKLKTELSQRIYDRLALAHRAMEVCESNIAFCKSTFQKAINNLIAQSGGKYLKILSQVQFPEIKNPYADIIKKESKVHFLIPFILGLLFLTSCGTGIFPKSTPPKKAVALYDLSENLLSHGDFFMIDQERFQQACMPEDMTGGFEYEQQCISDLRFGEEEQSIHLKPKGNLFESSDRAFRINENKVAQVGADMLNALKDKKHGRNKTYLFYQLHKTINELNQSKYASSRIIACTDWSDNSTLNFHNPSVLNTLKENQDSIYQQIEKEYPLSKLRDGKRIELIILFKSSNYEEDNRFNIISKHLVPFYEGRGISVHIIQHLNEITWTY